ncbi:MAG: hypothetical protein J7L45_01505 [Candidatus Aenigmarchaeota archaeon]|nr:hypothetical protein [Candidatus Aenigmarchaeota archaeon]
MGVIEEFLKRGYLISPNLIHVIEREGSIDQILNNLPQNTVVVTEEIYNAIKNRPKIKLIRQYTRKKSVKKIDDFVEFYNDRFKKLQTVLERRVEGNITTINKLSYGTEASIIGMVRDVEKNGFKLEDFTGSLFCISNEKVLEDEVLAVEGVVKKDGFLVKKIHYPDIPITNPVNLTDTDLYIAFTNNPDALTKNVSCIFTFTSNKNKIKKLKNVDIITTIEDVEGKNVHVYKEPFLVSVNNIVIYVLNMSWINTLKKKLNKEDEKDILITMLRKRHFLPFEYVEGDPYLLDELPDIIVVTGLSSPLFFNYKGISVISITNDHGFILNLKNREHEEIV